MCANETFTNTKSKSMRPIHFPVDNPAVADDGKQPHGEANASHSFELCLPKNGLVKGAVKHQICREVSLILTFFEHATSRI